MPETQRTASAEPFAPSRSRILAGATGPDAARVAAELRRRGGARVVLLGARAGDELDDGRARRLAGGAIELARDAMGHRSMYYARIGIGWAFSTSARLLAQSVPGGPRISPAGLALYLSCAFVPGRRTIVEDVFQVLPGETVRLAKEATFEQRWEPAPEPRRARSEDALVRELRELLERAVRERLPGGTLAASLSGGIDSSAVVALLGRLGGRPVRTYSISFGPEYRNELEWSSKVAAAVGTKHTIVVLRPPAVLAALDETMARLEVPIGDPLTVPNALLFREVARDAAELFNGEGGDPCFGGPKNLPMVTAEVFGAAGAAPDVARTASYLRAHQKMYDDLRRFLARDVRAAIGAGAVEAEIAAIFERSNQRRFVSRLQTVNVIAKGGHHILPKVEQLGASFGVRPLSPLFDRRIVEHSFEVPPELKLRGNVEKYLFKRAVADLLPHDVVHRPKSGMLVPVEGWFTGPLLDEARARLLDGLAPTRWFRQKALERLLAGTGGAWRPRRGAKIWLLVTLEAWWRTLLRPLRST